MMCLLPACLDTTKSKKGKLYPAGSIEVESTDSADHEGTGDGTKPEELNKKVLQIIQQVCDKLTGRARLGGWGGGRGEGVKCLYHMSYGFSSSGNDFPHAKGIDVCHQVQLLISQVTSHENLCQCYIRR